MIKQELLDYELYLDGKHIADFDDLENDAKPFGYLRVESKCADECVIVNKWTGEVVYHAFAKNHRKVVVEE